MYSNYVAKLTKTFKCYLLKARYPPPLKVLDNSKKSFKLRAINFIINS